MIKECWLQDPESRPIATAILQILDDYFETLQKDTQACPLPKDICAQQVGNNQIVMCNEPDTYHGNNESDTYLDGNNEPDTYLDGNDNCNTATSTDSCSQSSSAINQSQTSTTIFQNAVASDFPSNSQISSQKSGTSIITQLAMLKSKLKVTQYKTFQLAAIEALQDSKDTIVVQPTGSGKSLCYIASALMNPGKITLVVEPVVAVITNQIQSLKSKGIDAFALGRAAGKSKLANFRKVFKSSSDLPIIAFCTPEYLFGTPANGQYQATAGQFSALRDRIDDVHLIVLDEAHKIFDRMPSYQPAFDSMKRFKQIPCKLLAMSATLTTDQIQLLKEDFLHSDDCVVITEGVHRKNLVLNLKRYKRQKQSVNDMYAEIDMVDDVETDNSDALSNESSSWTRTAQGITDIVDSEVIVVYLDFVRNVEQMTNLLNKSNVSAIKYILAKWH